MTFSERLKELRIEKNKSQKALAEELNFSIPTLSHWECGYQEPSYKDLITLCTYFQVSTDYILGNSDDYGNSPTPINEISKLSKFSEILNYLINERSTTQKELAKSCGLSPQCVSALVTGRNNPTGTTLIALSKYFGCSSDYLLGLEDDFGARSEQNTGNVMHAGAALSEKEKALLKAFKNLLPETQDFVLRTAQSLSETNGEKSLKKS